MQGTIIPYWAERPEDWEPDTSGSDLTLSRSQAYQLFNNLINNAVQYNAYKGRVIIESGSDKKWVSVRNTDIGVGIPEDRLEQIWDEFSTSDAARRDPELKGMGLLIAIRIVSLHGGIIEVSSRGTGKGTSFRLRLPVKK